MNEKTAIIVWVYSEDGDGIERQVAMKVFEKAHAAQADAYAAKMENDMTGDGITVRVVKKEVPVW